MRFKVLFGLFICLGLLIGCDNDETQDVSPPPPHIAQVIVSVPVDTLWYPEGDSASTTVTVVVVDNYGDVMPGQKVSLALNNPELGFIEFLDPELLDTTNEQGRVELRFTAVGNPGMAMFTATAGGFGVRDSVYCEEIGATYIGGLYITSDTDTLLFPRWGTAETGVTVAVQGVFFDPIRNQQVAIVNETPQLGYISYVDSTLLDTTDNQGAIRLLFTATGMEGNAILSATAERHTNRDTIICRMMPDIIKVTISNFETHWSYGQLLFSYDFDVVFTSGIGTHYSGMQLQVSLSQGYLVEPLPFTDAGGRAASSVRGVYTEEQPMCITISDGRVEETECVELN